MTQVSDSGRLLDGSTSSLPVVADNKCRRLGRRERIVSEGVRASWAACARVKPSPRWKGRRSDGVVDDLALSNLAGAVDHR